jgi:hypothetical protein
LRASGREEGNDKLGDDATGAGGGDFRETFAGFEGISGIESSTAARSRLTPLPLPFPTGLLCSNEAAVVDEIGLGACGTRFVYAGNLLIIDDEDDLDGRASVELT